MSSLTPYPITPIGNFIGVVLALLPLISQIRKLSFAVWGYAIWIAVICFQNFVDTIIWHDNVNIVIPVWCDIGENLRSRYESHWPVVTVTKLQVGAGVGTRACALANCIRLYKITRLRGSIETAGQVRLWMYVIALADIFPLAQRRKIMVYELSLLLGPPVLIMALSLLFYVLLLTYIFNLWKQLWLYSLRGFGLMKSSDAPPLFTVMWDI